MQSVIKLIVIDNGSNHEPQKNNSKAFHKMSEVIRLYKYQALLSSRRALSRAEFMDLLEVSPATFKRDLAKLRDQLGIPIEYDRDAGGYRSRNYFFIHADKYTVYLSSNKAIEGFKLLAQPWP